MAMTMCASRMRPYMRGPMLTTVGRRNRKTPAILLSSCHNRSRLGLRGAGSARDDWAVAAGVALMMTSSLPLPISTQSADTVRRAVGDYVTGSLGFGVYTASWAHSLPTAVSGHGFATRAMSSGHTHARGDDSRSGLAMVTTAAVAAAAPSAVPARAGARIPSLVTIQRAIRTRTSNPRSVHLLARYPKILFVRPLGASSPARQATPGRGEITEEEHIRAEEEKEGNRSTARPNQDLDTDRARREHRNVALWLFTCAGMVFLIVVVGGLTRLTRSGLSMVDWRLTGSALPSSTQQWEAEFERYKQFPEYQIMYANNPEAMNLSIFKEIYFMEWFHRMLGRTVGLAFALPLAFFYLRRYRNLKPLRTRLAVLAALGTAQGGIGWWMVKSGLSNEELNKLNHQSGSMDEARGDQQGDHAIIPQRAPRVSPYRLAVHLLSAFAIYTVLTDTGIKVWSAATQPGAHVAASAPSAVKRVVSRGGVRGLVTGTAVLVAVTALSGALVAGNGAGLVYNEWPKMGGRWIPSDAVQPGLVPKWRNMFENLSLVQFNHRWLGQATWVASLMTAGTVFRNVSARFPRTYAMALFGTATLQALLGIGNLLYLVPIPLASLHQAGSLTLVTISILLANALAARRGGGAGRVLVRVLRCRT